MSVGRVLAPCETAPGPGQREAAGKGRGLGLSQGRHLPGCSMIDEPFCEPHPDSQPVQESGMHQQEPAGSGIQELPAEPTALMDSSARPD